MRSILKKGALWAAMAWLMYGGGGHCLAQDTAAPASAADSVYIRHVRLDCNRKTIDRIILREIQYKPGHRIARQGLEEALRKEASKVFNTKLFVLAEVLPIFVASDTIDLAVNVMEKWYIYPVPYVELADRNFNEWWRQRDRDLDRLIYGIRFTQQNFRGRNEDLKFTLQLGFTKKFEFEYNVPYIDRRQTTGMSFRVFYDNNKNMPYATAQNRLIFAKSEQILRERFTAETGVFKRSQYYNTHALDLRYNRHLVNDTITGLNPDYFLQGRTRLRFFELSYTFNRDIRDMASYPLKGMLLQLNATQKGLSSLDDINQFSVSMLYARFVQVAKPLYYSGSVRAYASFPDRQPFTEMRGFGYQSQFPRGYDLYVVDGPRWAVLKNTARLRLFASDHLLRNIIPIEQFSTIPIALYLKSYYDLGYVANPLAYRENLRLTNQLLWGTGAGLDLVIYNTTVMRFEYSFNREGDRGFFFNLMADF